MTRTHTCLACGAESRDVSMRLVEIDDADRRIVGVMVPVSNRDGAIEVRQDVPERYVDEPRCRDVWACRERVAALLLPPMADDGPPPAHEAEEVDVSAWM